MDLLTIKLKELGEDCVVFNANGDAFLDIAKCDCIAKGYQDEYELSMIAKLTKKKTKNGLEMISVSKVQSESERLAKAPFRYIGNGIRLFSEGDDNATTTSSTPKSPSRPLPN